MNSELILKLSREAEFLAREHVRDCEYYGYTMVEGTAEDEFHAEFRDRFAELIVREHMSLLTDCYRGTTNAQEWDNALLFLEKHIKEHFGVEE